jgi:hypothetical protein
LPKTATIFGEKNRNFGYEFEVYIFFKTHATERFARLFVNLVEQMIDYVVAGGAKIDRKSESFAHGRSRELKNVESDKKDEQSKIRKNVRNKSKQ